MGGRQNRVPKGMGVRLSPWAFVWCVCGPVAPTKTVKEPGEKHRLKPYFNFGGRKFFNHMNPEQEKTIQKVADEVRQKLEGEGSGHDWWHIVRVWNMAKHIGKSESADIFVVELAALLHDIADWKFHDGDDTVGPKIARQVLEKHSVSAEVINEVCNIIIGMSFKGAGVKTEMKTLEGKVVQDSDRLDAIGAIAIARAFAYGGAMNRPIYDPIVPRTPLSDASYASTQTSKNRPTIHHFYDKLLHLKDRLNTKTARQLAERRHKFMELYLKEFFEEWGE